MSAGLANIFPWVWWDPECASSTEAFLNAVSMLLDSSWHV